MKNNTNLSTTVAALVILAIYIGFFVFARQYIPSTEVILQTMQTLYYKYGYALIFFGAMFEGMFVIGNYVPGSAMILLGAALSRTGTLQLPLVILCATSGLVISYCINYALGKFGWFHILSRFGIDKTIKMAEEKLQNHKNKAMFLGFIYPGSAALLASAAGVLKIPFRQFVLIAIVSQFFWSSVWAILAYFVGIVLVEVVLKSAVFIFVAIGVVWFFRNFYKKL